MENIMTYDWTSEKGEFQQRSVIFEEFYKNGKKYYKLINDLKPEELGPSIIEAEYDNDRLKFVKSQLYEILEGETEGEYELLPISGELSEKIKTEQKENFRFINEMLEEKIDLKKVDELIDSVEILEKRDLKPTGTSGMCNRFATQIALRSDIIDSDDIKAQKTRLHEFIHLIQSIDKIFYNIVLDESQVEALAVSMIFLKNDLGESKTWYTNKLNNKEININYDFNISRSYVQPLAFLRQMEVAMEREFYKKNLVNRIGFYDDFSHRYGSNLLKYLAVRIDKIYREAPNDYDELAKYIKETQDVLFKKVFDKDVDAIGSTEGAIKVLEKMRKMRKYRPTIYVFSENKSNFYDGFPKLYDEYYKKIGRKLAYIGCSKQEIVKALEPYRYENIEIIKDENKIFDNLIVDLIAKYEEKEQRKFDPETTGFKYIIGNYEELIYEIYKKETGKAILYGVINSSTLMKRKEKNIVDENSMPQLIKSKFKPLVDAGKRFKEVDVTRYMERIKEKRTTEAVSELKEDAEKKEERCKGDEEK